MNIVNKLFQQKSFFILPLYLLSFLRHNFRVYLSYVHYHGVHDAFFCLLLLFVSQVLEVFCVHLHPKKYLGRMVINVVLQEINRANSHEKVLNLIKVLFHTCINAKPVFSKYSSIFISSKLSTAIERHNFLNSSST